MVIMECHTALDLHNGQKWTYHSISENVKVETEIKKSKPSNENRKSRNQNY